MSYGEFLNSTTYKSVYHLADGDNANGDSSLDLTLSNTTTAVGKFGTCQQTTGDNGVLTCASEFGITKTSGFTYHIWYKHTSSGEYDTGSYILFHGISSQLMAPSIIWEENNTRLYCPLYTTGPIVSPWTMNTTSFDLFTFTYTSAGYVSIYVNSSFLGTKYEVPTGTSPDTARFSLGSYLWDAPRRRYINGYYDETIVCNYPWTDAEIKKYYNQAKGRINPGMV